MAIYFESADAASVVEWLRCARGREFNPRPWQYTLNLLMRCMSGDSLASMFYWTIYKRGDTEGKTLMGRSHTILQQYGLTLNKAIFNDIFRINNKTVIYEQYSYGQNGLVDSLRAIFNDYTFDNKRYAQMLLRFHTVLTLF